MARKYLWTAAIFCFVAGEAVTMQMRGPLLTSFQATFDVQDSFLGLITPAGTIGFIGALIVVGFKTGNLNIKRLLILASAGTGLTTIVVSLSSTFGFLLLFLFFQGLMAGVFRALDRPVLSHLYPESRGRIFALYTLIWAVGATLAPLYVNYILETSHWKIAYLLVGFVFLIPVLLLFDLSRPTQLGNEENLSLEAFYALFRKPAVRAMGFCLVLSGGIEGALFTWLPYYAEQFFSTQEANQLLSIYFVSYIPGRFAYSYLISRYDHFYFLIVLVTASIPIYISFLTYTNELLFGNVALLGFLVSGFFPLLLAIGVEAVPEHSGPANAIATVANFIGITLFPVLVGGLVAIDDINLGILVPFGLLVVLLGGLLWFKILLSKVMPA